MMKSNNSIGEDEQDYRPSFKINKSIKRQRSSRHVKVISKGSVMFELSN